MTRNRYKIGIIAFLLLTITSAQGNNLVPLFQSAPPLPRQGWINSTPVDLAAQRGKLVLLYFFFPACDGCDTFTLHLKRLQLRYPKRLLTIGVADQPEAHLRAFARNPLNRVYRILRDPGKSVTRRYMGKLLALPGYALLDETGRLVWLDHGQYRLPLALELERRLRQLSGKADPPVPTPKTLRALLVANQQDHLTGRSLPTPLADARALASQLQRNGFAQIECLTDTDDSQIPLVRRARQALTQMVRRSAPGDGLLIYYSGSGLQEGEDEQLRIQLFLSGSSTDGSWSLRDIDQQLAAVDLSNLILIDIGHEASRTRPYRNLTSALDQHYPHSTIFFSASRWVCLSMEQPRTTRGSSDQRRSRFTYHLLKGLGGAANIDGNGHLDARELFRHLWVHMYDINRDEDQCQVPFAAGLQRNPPFRVLAP